jgi:hypothetical protein
MNESKLVFQKLPKAAEALARRDPVLTPKMRSLLILIDGKRDSDELAKLAGPEAPGLLAELSALGMVSGSTRPPEKSGAPSSRPAPLQAGVSLSDLRRAAVRRLTDLLGPTSEDLCLRIESARTPEELSAVLRRAEAAVRDFSGAQVAERFSREMHAQGAM